MGEPLLLRDARPVAGEEPVDVSLVGGRVDAVRPRGGPSAGAEEVALDGRLLIPGLWDEHVHMEQWALHAARLRLDDAPTAVEAAARVRARIADRPVAHPPLVGVGFRDATWPDVPTLALLDAAAGDEPVVLQSHDLHCVWLNSAAARLLGVTVDGSGLLREEAAFAATRLAGHTPDAVLDRLVAEAGAAAAARGVVGVVDFEMRWSLSAWERRFADGFDALRVEAAVYPFDLGRATDAGYRTGHALGSSGLLTVGPLKVLIDGSLNTRTAYCFDPYPDGGTGILTVPVDELDDLLARAVGAGFTPAVHAIGDRAVAMALDAYARAGARGRIEHAQLVAVEDVARFAALGVTASAQPEHLLDDRDIAEHHWAGRTERAFPLRSLVDSGAAVVFGSDAPVAPLDPLMALSAAIGRTRDGRAPWHPEQRLDPATALRSATRGGRVAPGEAADLAVLDTDVWPDAESLRAQRVALTLLAGRATHRAL